MDKPSSPGECASCRHWIADDDGGWEQPPNFRLCGKIIERWRIPRPEPDDFVTYNGEPGEYQDAVHASIAKSMAYVEDGSEYKAYLRTREDFGCRLWEGSGK